MSSLRVRVGKRVADQRKRVGYSQAQLAEMIGVATETISRLETGAALPAVERLGLVAAALEIDLEDLFRRRPRDSPEEKAVERLLWLLGRKSVDEIELIITIAARIFEHISGNAS